MSVTPQKKTKNQIHLNSMYIMCDYSIAIAWEWQKLSTLSIQLLQTVAYHHYSSTYSLIKRKIAQEPKQKVNTWTP